MRPFVASAFVASGEPLPWAISVSGSWFDGSLYFSLIGERQIDYDNSDFSGLVYYAGGALQEGFTLGQSPEAPWTLEATCFCSQPAPPTCRIIYPGGAGGMIDMLGQPIPAFDVSGDVTIVPF